MSDKQDCVACKLRAIVNGVLWWKRMKLEKRNAELAKRIEETRP